MAFHSNSTALGGPDENFPLMNQTAETRPSEEDVRTMEWCDLQKATNAIFSAYSNDPVGRYIKNTSDVSGTTLYDWRLKLSMRASIAATIAGSRGFTIHAESFVALVPATETPQHAHWSIRLFSIWRSIFRVTKFLLSREQLKRQDEYAAKLDAVTKRSLGDRQSSIVWLGNLCTIPERQGHGYGTRLIKYITDKADAESRPTALISSNVANTTLYERCGFSTVGELTLGEDNPNWIHTPVVVRLMVRDVMTPKLNEKLLKV